MSGAIFTADVWLLYFYFFVRFSVFDILNFSTKEGRVAPLSFLKLAYVWCVCACVCICVNIYVYMWQAHTSQPGLHALSLGIGKGSAWRHQVPPIELHGLEFI